MVTAEATQEANLLAALTEAAKTIVAETVSPDEAARLRGVHRATVERAMNMGRLPFIRIMNHRLIPRVELERLKVG
jgi:excisionase family DNA binding protein